MFGKNSSRFVYPGLDTAPARADVEARRAQSQTVSVGCEREGGCNASCGLGRERQQAHLARSKTKEN